MVTVNVSYAKKILERFEDHLVRGIKLYIHAGDLYWEPVGSGLTDKPVYSSEVFDAVGKGFDIIIVDTDGKMYKALSVYAENDRAGILILSDSATSGNVTTRTVFSRQR